MVGVVAIVLVVFVLLAIRNGFSEHQRNTAPGILAVFKDLRVTATHLLEGTGAAERSHPLPGLTARVDDSGTMNRRITATRMVLLGPFALAAPKQLDDRTVYLTVEGPTTALLREVTLKRDPGAGAKAREFAARLNMHANRAATTSPPPATTPAAAVPPPAQHPPSISRPAQLSPPVRRPQPPPPTPPPAMTWTPGWYPDQNGVIRWFDGYGWTQATRMPPPPQPTHEA